MPKRLLAHFNQYVSISEEEFLDILPYFERKTARKKEMISLAGTSCDQVYFVLEGCLNMYFTTEKGNERTVQFAIENWWLTDDLAYMNKQPTEFNIQAVEKTVYLAISHDQHMKLFERFPKLEKYFRSIYQIAYGASLIKFKFLQDLSKEEIYFHFTENFPGFTQRVPQYLIASFLGLTPEYVSEIRAKRRS